MAKRKTRSLMVVRSAPAQAAPIVIRTGSSRPARRRAVQYVTRHVRRQIGPSGAFSGARLSKSFALASGGALGKGLAVKGAAKFAVSQTFAGSIVTIAAHLLGGYGGAIGHVADGAVASVGGDLLTSFAT